jgi:hypothetical protein
MAEQPVNLSTVLYLGVFSRAEQRVLQAIFKAIAEGGGRCVATLALLARDSNTSNHAQCDRPGGRNRPSEKDRTPLLLRGLACQHFDLRESAHGSATHEASPVPRRIDLHADRLNRERALRFFEPNGLGQAAGRAH